MLRPPVISRHSKFCELKFYAGTIVTIILNIPTLCGSVIQVYFLLQWFNFQCFIVQLLLSLLVILADLEVLKPRIQKTWQRDGVACEQKSWKIYVSVYYCEKQDMYQVWLWYFISKQLWRIRYGSSDNIQLWYFTLMPTKWIMWNREHKMVGKSVR